MVFPVATMFRFDRPGTSRTTFLFILLNKYGPSIKSRSQYFDSNIYLIIQIVKLNFIKFIEKDKQTKYNPCIKNHSKFDYRF